MPYIKQEDRVRIVGSDEYSDTIRIDEICTAGELNYAFTEILLSYLKRKGLNYQHINDIVGALEGAKLEAYRRRASHYEDGKIQENGDVY